MINTLSVATQGHIPNLTSLSLSTLGWLGGEVVVFIENNEYIWTLGRQDGLWHLLPQDIEWAIGRDYVQWTVSEHSTEWNTTNRRIQWTLSIDEKE